MLSADLALPENNASIDVTWLVSTGWPKKVSHYQMIKIVLNHIKTCKCH